MRLHCLTASLALALLSTSANAAVLYTDSFSGTGALNGALVQGGDLQTGAVAWAASGPFGADGAINGTIEGGAYLPFEPEVNKVYTVSLDVLNRSTNWIALGFARDPLATPGGDNLNDRMSNETEGIAWMLYRNNGLANAVQSFTGLRTAGGADLNSAGLNFQASNNLSVVIDTTGDGSNFTADWRINGVSLRTATINVNINDINYVGMSFDDSTTTPVSYDNFLLTVIPEPASAGLLALGLTAVVATRRRD